MTNKREHDTQELYVKEINWPEIKRRVKIAFKVSFVFLTILVLIMLFLPSPRDPAETIYICIAIFLGTPMAIASYSIENIRRNRSRLFVLFFLGLVIGLLIALITSEVLFIPLILTTLIPVMHLIRYENAGVEKYLWGGASSIIGFVVSIFLFVLAKQLSSFLLFLLWGFSWLGILPLAIFIALLVGLIVAFYWFFISLAEEIYRIKYEKTINIKR